MPELQHGHHVIKLKLKLRHEEVSAIPAFSSAVDCLNASLLYSPDGYIKEYYML
jgi:hypothetical protein